MDLQPNSVKFDRLLGFSLKTGPNPRQNPRVFSSQNGSVNCRRKAYLGPIGSRIHHHRNRGEGTAMDNLFVWLIIIAFYAPLHYLLPAMVLFITGRESEAVRQRLIRRALFDSTLSMVGAFAVAIYLAEHKSMSTAMLVLLLSMLYPFVGIWRHRREITAEASEE